MNGLFQELPLLVISELFPGLLPTWLHRERATCEPTSTPSLRHLLHHRYYRCVFLHSLRNFIPKRQISKTEPNGAATYYAYDVANNLTSLTDPAGNITNFGYDGQNRLVINTNALSKSKSYIYDVSGNLTRTVDRNGRTIQYVHDGLDRVIEEKWITNSANPSLSVSTTTQGGNLNEVQRVGWTASSSMSGTFTLTFSGQTTSAISASATAAQVASALEAFPTLERVMSKLNSWMPLTELAIGFIGLLSKEH